MKVIVHLEAFDSEKPENAQHPLRVHSDYADFDELPEFVSDEYGFAYQKDCVDWEGWIIYTNISGIFEKGKYTECKVQKYIVNYSDR